MSHNSFATRANLDVIEDYYQCWQQDPDSVSPDWRLFFEGFELALQGGGPGPQSSKQAAVTRLISAYRDLGHFLAHLDPLGQPRATHEQLELSFFGLSDADLDRTFDPGSFLGVQGPTTLRDLIAALRETYCRTIGFEYGHIQDLAIRRWLQERIEPFRSQPGL
jgi:2-oxoglutarate dehydrogenase E1 component